MENGIDIIPKKGEIFKRDTETPYKNGKIDGIRKVYYFNGKLRHEPPFKNGKADGVWKKYYENGILEEELPYKNGKSFGERKYYRENGTLRYLLDYKNGKLVGGKCGDKPLTNNQLDIILITMFLSNAMDEFCP